VSLPGQVAGATYPLLDHQAPGLGARKQAWWSAAKGAGASDSEAAVIVAQMMQEGRRDAAKDGAGGARNLSELNLNQDLLARFGGVPVGQQDALNRTDAQGRSGAAVAALAAMRTLGLDGYLAHVRGGQTGYERPDDDVGRFARSIMTSANSLLRDLRAEPGNLGSDRRFAADIPGI